MRHATQRQRHLIAGVVLGTVALLIGGCGGGSADDSSTSPTATAQAANPSQDATQAPASVSALAQTQAPRRRPHSYDRKGVTSIAVAPDGGSLAVASVDGRVRLFDASGSRQTKLFRPAGSPAAAGVVFGPGGRDLISVSRNSTAQVWDAKTGERLLALQGHEQPLRAVGASADGSVIATAGEETRVLLWDGATGKLKRVFSGPTDFVNAVSVSRDGRWLASGDAAGRVLVWNTATGQLAHTLLGHANEVNAVAFSPDGRSIVSVGEDGKALLWDTASGAQVATLKGAGAALRSVTFSHDGGLLAAGAVDGTVAIFDMSTRRLARQAPGSKAAVNAVAFDASGDNVIFFDDSDPEGGAVSLRAAR